MVIQVSSSTDPLAKHVAIMATCVAMSSVFLNRLDLDLATKFERELAEQTRPILQVEGEQCFPSWGVGNAGPTNQVDSI